MSLFNKFPPKTLYEVAQILSNAQYESILHYIDESDLGYGLTDMIENISAIPNYQFAVACSLAALGNPEEADEVFPNSEKIIAVSGGDQRARQLFEDFML